MFSQCCSARNLNKYIHKSLIFDDISRSRRSHGNFLWVARLRVRGFSGEEEENGGNSIHIFFISFDVYSILEEYYNISLKDLLNFVKIFFPFFSKILPFFSLSFSFVPQHFVANQFWKTFHSVLEFLFFDQR